MDQSLHDVPVPERSPSRAQISTILISSHHSRADTVFAPGRLGSARAFTGWLSPHCCLEGGAAFQPCCARGVPYRSPESLTISPSCRSICMQLESSARSPISIQRSPASTVLEFTSINRGGLCNGQYSSTGAGTSGKSAFSAFFRSPTAWRSL